MPLLLRFYPKDYPLRVGRGGTETGTIKPSRSAGQYGERFRKPTEHKQQSHLQCDERGYDYQELKAFSTAYLPGFLADKFDVTVEACRERADLRCAGTLTSALRDTVKGYDTCMPTSNSVNLKRGKVHYAMMPVWMLNTKWKGKDFLFAMNGQTGKLVGDLPVSWGKVWGLFAAIAAPLSVLGSLLAVFVL